MAALTGHIGLSVKERKMQSYDGGAGGAVGGLEGNEMKCIWPYFIIYMYEGSN